jgi:hypothetical protein
MSKNKPRIEALEEAARAAGILPPAVKAPGRDIFGDAARAKLGRVSGLVPSKRRRVVDPPASAPIPATEAPTDPTATIPIPVEVPPTGFGGGAGVANPGAGESFGDSVRRHVFG